MSAKSPTLSVDAGLSGRGAQIYTGAFRATPHCFRSALRATKPGQEETYRRSWTSLFLLAPRSEQTCG